MIRKYFNFGLFSIFIGFFFIFFASYNEGFTEPEIEPGSRDYTWGGDTLQVLFDELSSVDKDFGEM